MKYISQVSQLWDDFVRKGIWMLFILDSETREAMQYPRPQPKTNFHYWVLCTAACTSLLTTVGELLLLQCYHFSHGSLEFLAPTCCLPANGFATFLVLCNTSSWSSNEDKCIWLAESGLMLRKLAFPTSLVASYIVELLKSKGSSDPV